jgi:hypothetical protein
VGILFFKWGFKRIIWQMCDLNRYARVKPILAKGVQFNPYFAVYILFNFGFEGYKPPESLSRGCMTLF